MASDFSPHNACGKIFFCLKKSNLNYVVKETPFSAYVTIRKKFIQSKGENLGPSVIDSNDTTKKRIII